MKNKEHLKRVQVEQFYNQLNALNREENELYDQFNIARNLACSEWEVGPIPSPCGGRDGLRVKRMLPENMKLLQENLDKHREDISYRRYAQGLLPHHQRPDGRRPETVL